MFYASINGYIYVVGGPTVDIYRRDLDTRSSGKWVYIQR